MRLDYTASPFVIIGGWNPNIVNEVWIRKNLLDNSNEQLNIGIGGGFSPTGIPMAITEAMFRNIRFAVLGERLELNLMAGNDFTNIKHCIDKICTCLPTTLVTGYGVNFTYVADNINQNFISTFLADTLSQSALDAIHTYRIILNGITTNINIDISNQQGKSAVRFNFHFPIDDLSKLIRSVIQYPIESLRSQSIEFIQNNYGISVGG